MSKNKEMQLTTFNTRVAALQCTYSVLFMGEKLTSKTIKYFKTKSFLSESDEADNKDIIVNDKLFSFLVRGLIRNKDIIDAKITPHFKIEMEKNDMLVVSIIRLGAYEIMFRDNTPVPVIISEYTKIANAFYPTKKAALVNAVLDKIKREAITSTDSINNSTDDIEEEEQYTSGQEGDLSLPTGL